MIDWRQKTVWITGASSGIGAALSAEMNAKGARIILSARNEARLKEVQENLPSPANTKILVFDLEDSDQREKAVAQLKQWDMLPDILVNNGGISQREEAINTSLEVDRKIMEVNYFASVHLSKLLLEHLISVSGRIVAVSSIAGRFGFPLRSAYSAAKHALVGFFETLSLELDKSPCKVHIIFPGRVKTSISNYALKGDGNLHGSMDAGQAEGISAKQCALDIMQGMEKNKLWIYSGGKELYMWKIYKFFPNYFRKLALKVSAK